MGPAILSALFGCIMLFTATRYAPQPQRIWVGCIQTRIDATYKMLGAMKAVKILGLTSTMQSLLQSWREEEIRMALRFRRISVLRLSLGNGSEVLAPGLAFAAYAAVSKATGKPLDITSAYSSLSIVSLMTLNLGETIQNLPTILSAIACFERIQDFLNLPARRDHRLDDQVSIGSCSPTSGNGVSTAPSQGSIELDKLQSRYHATSSSKPVLRLESASFSWTKTGEHVIRDVSMAIAPSTLNCIVGPVGSGKSTLLKALVGEVAVTKGFVYSRTRTAGLVDQTSWIQNGSVRSNIIGQSSYHRDWYNAVIQACALTEDLISVPRGDRTRVGSAGVGLSGGQNHRVALARAIYMREKLLLLDDCFSGLDSTTEDRIFSRLFGRGGLLRTNGTTVVLVTHAFHRLSIADNILVLSAQGQLVQQGTFDVVMREGHYLQTVTAKVSAESTAKEESVLDNCLAIRSGSHPMLESEGEGKEKGTALNDHETDDDQEEEDFGSDLKDPARSSGDWKTYVNYFASCGWTNFAFFLCGLIGFAVLQRMPDIWIKYWTAATLKHGSSVNDFYLAIFLLFEFLSVVCLVCTGFLVFLKMTPSSSLRQHLTLLRTTMAAPLSFFASTDTGVTLNRFSQDMNLLDVELPPGYLEFCAQSIIVTVQAILVSFSSGYFAASIPFILIIVYFLQKYYLRTSRQLRLLDLEAKSPLYSHFVETLEGLATIRVFRWSTAFQKKNTTLLESSQKPFYMLYCVQRWLSLFLDLVVASLLVLLMVLFVNLRGSVDPGFAGIALVNMSGFSQSLTLLIKAWTTLETSMGAISRIDSFAAQTPSENIPGDVRPPEEWSPTGNIEFTSLSVCYKPESPPVLRDITLRILPGQEIGICGPSGSGKSTIISTLFRMTSISSGSVTIDGVDISALSCADLRMYLTAIPQEPFFFKGSIRQNVDPFNLCTDEQRIVALQKVQLWSVLQNRGASLDTPIDLDILFSHGQRQLLCLARAILCPRKIVVLDEATSSVDFATEEVMQKIFREDFHECTVICVAHRLATILDFDRIAVLKAGELVEFDAPHALMSRDSASKALLDSC